jgi:hypothetical protein
MSGELTFGTIDSSKEQSFKLDRIDRHIPVLIQNIPESPQAPRNW